MMKKANQQEKCLRELKLYLRDQVRNCNKIFRSMSYLSPIAGRLGFHIIKWSKKTYEALVLIYDKKILDYGIDPTTRKAWQHWGAPEGCASPETKWLFIHKNSISFKSDIWNMINNVTFRIRDIVTKENEDKNKDKQ